MKALVRWATGKRLTNRLPKLSLITLSLPLNSGILGLRMGPYVPTPKFFTTSGDPRRVIHQILDMRKYAFLYKAFSWWTWDSNSRPTTHGLSTTPFVKALVRLGTGKKLTNRLPKLSLMTLSPPSEQRDSWSSYGAVRAYSEVLYNLWGPRESDSSDS